MHFTYAYNELKSLTHASIFTLIFIEIIFTIGKMWKRLRSLIAGEQINKKWNMHETECCATSNIKKF